MPGKKERSKMVAGTPARFTGNLPLQVKIFDSVYSIEYVEAASDVDIMGRQTAWGQTDEWTRSIRIYKKDLPEQEVWNTVWHEIIHIILGKFHVKRGEFEDLTDNEQVIETLATGLNTIIFDNGWMV